MPEAETGRRYLEANCLGKNIAEFVVRDARVLDNVDAAFPTQSCLA
jgi:formamidopyrimidine-DNA glycosylase